jgi:ABC-type transporter Mla MlaB component
MSDTPSEIVLSSVLDITGAPALLDLCKKFTDSTASLNIDASDVERITTPALQILISLIKKRLSQNLHTQVNPRSNAFENAIKALGVSDFLTRKV